MLAEPQGAAETGPGPLAGPGRRLQRMVRQEAPQMPAHGDRADAGPAAAVRDAERLVQVQVRDVGAELARLRQPHERVEVGAVDVDLPARLVHERADLAHRALVDAVCRGVRDHQRRDVLAVLGELGPQVAEIDVAVARRRPRRRRACRPSRRSRHSCRARSTGSGRRRAARRRARGGRRGSRAGPRTRPASRRSAAARRRRSPVIAHSQRSRSSISVT